MTNTIRRLTVEEAAEEINRRFGTTNNDYVVWTPRPDVRPEDQRKIDLSRYNLIRDLGLCECADTSNSGTYLTVRVLDPETGEQFPMSISRLILAMMLREIGCSSLTKGWVSRYRDGADDLRDSNLKLLPASDRGLDNSYKASWIANIMLDALEAGKDPQQALIAKREELIDRGIASNDNAEVATAKRDAA